MKGRKDENNHLKRRRRKTLYVLPVSKNGSRLAEVQSSAARRLQKTPTEQTERTEERR